MSEKLEKSGFGLIKNMLLRLHPSNYDSDNHLKYSLKLIPARTTKKKRLWSQDNKFKTLIIIVDIVKNNIE